MNVELLNKVKERILAEPEGYNQSILLAETQCGTVAVALSHVDAI